MGEYWKNVAKYRFCTACAYARKNFKAEKEAGAVDGLGGVEARIAATAHVLWGPELRWRSRLEDHVVPFKVQGPRQQRGELGWAYASSDALTPP